MRTLRSRLTVLSTLVVALAFSVTGLVILTATSRAQTRDLERDLESRLTALNQLRAEPFRPGGGRPGAGAGGQQDESRLQALRDAAERTLGPGFFLVVRIDGGPAILTLGDVPDSLPDPSTGLSDSQQGRRPDGLPGFVQAAGVGERFVSEDGRTYLVRGVSPARAGTLALQMGADVDRLVADGQRDLRQRFLVVGAAATAVTALVTSLIAGVATRPLRRLREATERVAATEDLTTRVHLDDAPGEVEAVAEGLNTMLARLQDSTGAREAALHAALRFAADAGHELRTPLTSVQSTLDTLVRNPTMPDEMRREVMEEVAGEARRLAALLESLQALARADAGQAGEIEAVDIGEVTDAAIDAMRQQHPRMVITLRQEEPAVVMGAAPWLRSILDNLLRNAAVHAAGPDGEPPTVTVRLGTREGWVHLAVDDNGPGIAVGQREVVLRRFTRGSDSAGRPGSGLGLSLVAQLAAVHGGGLRLGEAPGGGLRAEVRLPAAAAPGHPV